MRRYAQDTQVGIGRSRQQIDQLLREWGALGIQWSDEFVEGRVSLRFIWPHEGHKYMARVTMKLPSDDELKEDALDGRSGRFSDSKFRKLQSERGRQEHRVLGLWLKAALNAVELGLVTAEELFLPFMEGQDGRTFSEIAIPRLDKLLSGTAERLLPAAPGGK